MSPKSLHLAIILDGNRRWARKRALPASIGHRKGVENLRKLLPEFIAQEVSHITVYALSTENLKERGGIELKNLFRLIEKFAKDNSVFHENEIQVNVFGELRGFPASTKKALTDLVKETTNHKKLVLNLGVGYGGRAEIVRAANEFVKKGKRANEKTFRQALYSKNQPDPDLLIRTGGKQRISNFLIWQLAYAELYFTEKMWPEFDKTELKKALEWFCKQKRTFGK